MRIRFLLLLTLGLQATPSAYGQELTLSFQNAPLEKVFKEIHQQSGYSFVYTRSQLLGSNRVTLQVSQASLQQALDLCFAGQPLTYMLEDKYIIVRNRRMDPDEQRDTTREISGLILSETGQPVAGASVTAQKSGRGTSTDGNGHFRLKNLPPEERLLISCIGFREKEVAVPASGTLSIRLSIALSGLDEAVVMGYGITSRKLNTGNIGKVSSAAIEAQPVSNVLQTLAGRVPGLLVTQTSGVPGAQVKVQIRGQNSILQGSDPLFVIDGVPFAAGSNTLNQINTAALLSPFSILNPDDIESIEILKDADATSIYGSRGSNGVVLITTKKGAPGQAHFFGKLTQGWSRVSRFPSFLNTPEYLMMRREAFNNDGMVPNSSNAPDLLEWDTTRYTDWSKELIGHTASQLNAQFGLSGGSETTSFLLSAGYNRQTTVYPGNLADHRANLHANINFRNRPGTFRINWSADYGSEVNKLGSYDLTAFVNLPPHLQLREDDGSLKWTQSGSSFRSLGLNNPYAYLLQRYTGKFDNLVSHLSIDLQLARGLTLKTSMGYNLFMTDEQRINPGNSFDPATGNLPFSYFANRKQSQWIIEPQLEYVANISAGKLTFLAGSTWQENLDNLLTVDARNYSSDLQLESIAAAGSQTTANQKAQYRYNSAFGRLSYNWRNRYLLNLTGRRDGSSRFGPASQFSNFYSVAGAWIFSGESFFQKAVPFISFGKLRMSYGTSGNDNIGNYQFVETWSSTQGTYLGNPGLYPTRLFTPNYSWELNKKQEIGLDLGLAKNKVMLYMAYFRNRCGNQLIPYTLPIQTGFTSVTKNLAADVQNSGFEFSATVNILKTNTLKWDLDMNISVQNNRLISFPGLETSSYAHTYIIGKPLSSKRVFDFLGVNPETGAYEFNDVNKDGKLSYDDKVRITQTEPSCYGGIQTSLMLRNWQLLLFAECRKQSGQNFLASQLYNVPGYDFKNQPAFVQSRWQKQGDITKIERFTADYTSEAYTNAVYYLGNSAGIYGNASFIRIKNIQLSFAFPNGWITPFGLQKLQLALQGQNLFTITSYKGADPENQNLLVLPPLRTIAFSLQANF